MFAIGVGTAVDPVELEAIAGAEDRVYYAQNFEDLQEIEAHIIADAKVSSGPCPEPYKRKCV